MIAMKYIGIALACVLGVALFVAMAFFASLFQAADSLYHQEQGHVTASGVQD